jgi:carboxymethylenebutenolidase
VSKFFPACAAAAALVAGTAFAADNTVSFQSGTEKVDAFLVTPDGPGPAPAIVVIHEWWGLDNWVKDQARALAKAGYVALAVDLYRGKVTDKQEEAHQLMSGLPSDRAVRDLRSAVAYLRALPEVRKDRIGSLGWCMGGRYSYALATEDKHVVAAAGYYGAPPTDATAISRINGPVLGNFGAEDKGPSPEQVKAFEVALKAAGKTADIKIYQGAGHAFANPNNPWGGYREAAAKDAWSRTISFFDSNLKK